MTPQETELEKAQTALRNGEVYTYKGVKYSLTKLRDELIPALKDDVLAEQTRIDAETKAKNLESSTEADVKNQTKLSIKRAKSLKKDAEFSAGVALTKFNDGDISEQEYLTALELPKKIQADITAMESGSVNAKLGAGRTYEIIGAEPVAATTGTQPTTAGGRTLTAAESKAATTGRTLQEPTGVAPIPPVVETVVTDKTVPPTDAAGKRKAYVDAQLVTQKLEDTPANRKKLREEFNATQPAGKTTVVDTEWESTFKEKFPSKAWLLTEIDRAKYPQLFSTIQNAITTKMYDSTTGLALFEEQLKGTDFFKEISTSGKVQEIKKLVGNLGFDTTDFVQFVNTSINFGWTGDKLKQETYKNAFDVDPGTGKYLNPNAVSRVRASADYISTQNIAKQFFNMNPSETDVLKVLTGEQTAADYEMQQREFVKNIESYKHLAPLLDLGLTMTGIADRYRKTAADLLEVDENSIDMSTANYEQALTYNDNGKMRLMTNGEWEKLLRTDPRYKWEYTNNAKSEARSLSSNIAQALGKVV
jgi:hypothetical protein